MTDWGLYEIDDVVWDGIGGSDDHIVPVPEDAREGTCMVKGEHRKKSFHEIFNAVSKSKEKKPVGNKDGLLTGKTVLSCSSTKDEPLPQLLDMDPLCDLQCEKQFATYSLTHGDTVMGNKPVDNDCYRDVKLESANSDLLIGSYKEDSILENGNSILVEKEEALLNSSCPFSLSDICPPESELDFFGNKHEDKESCSLLDYGWANLGNFEDVDRLLRSCESTFGQLGNSSVDELSWPFSSSACVDTGPQENVQKGRVSSSPESRALKGKLKQNELRMEFMACDYPSLLATGQEDDSKVQDCQQNDSIKNKPLKQETSEHIQDLEGNSGYDYNGSCVEQHVGHGGNSEGTQICLKEEDGTSHDVDKVNYRKQTVGHKQPEKKHKKNLSDKKIIQNTPPVICYSVGFRGQQSLSPKSQISASPALQILPSPLHTSQKQLVGTGSLRQVYPQFPYIHAGYGYPLHHMPIMPSSTPRPQADRTQQLYVGYQLPADVSSQPQHTRKPFEIPLRPPSMTPQEKIEKLKWRQQMQARLAVEYQQQQFSSQNVFMNHSVVHRQQQDIQCQQAGLSPKEGHNKILQSSSAESFTPLENSSAASGVTYSNNDGSLEANVLNQLQHTIARLDMKTRFCIRDSLYRLARSAMERRCFGDNKTISENGEHIEAIGLCTFINSDHSQDNRCAGLNDMETQTNPIDRTIAHLLFHKHSLPSAGSLSMVADSSNATLSMSPSSFSATPNIWSCQPAAYESPTEVCINSTTNLHFPVPVELPLVISKTDIGCSSQNMINIKGSSSNSSCSASDVLFHPPQGTTSASMDLQNTEDISVSKQQVVSQNNGSICPNINCSRLTERGPILDNNESLTEVRCQNLPKHEGVSKVLSPNTQNMVKQKSLESMEVDILNTDSDTVDVLN